MAFHRIPYSVRVTLVGHHGGDPRETVLHYRRSSALPNPSGAQLLELLNNLAGAGSLVQTLRQAVAGGTTWTSMKAVDVDMAAGTFAELVFLTPVVAGRTGDVLPGGEQVCITKVANVAGRGKNGRMFVMDIAEQDQNDSLIGTGLVTLLTNFAIQMIASRTTSYGNFVPVIPSPTHDNFWNIAGLVFDSLMDTLRTRQLGKKRHKRSH